MKKILLVSDGLVFPSGAFRLIKMVFGEDKGWWIKGVSLRVLDYNSLIAYNVANQYNEQGTGRPEETFPLSEITGTEDRFKDECKALEIPYLLQDKLVYRNLSELILETRFADLLMISGDFFYNRPDEAQPNEMMRQLLHKSECPVMLVPDDFANIGGVVYAYDGSAVSMYAIRQFNYLFPQVIFPFHNVIYFGKDEEPVPGARLLKEYFSRQSYQADILHQNENELKGFSAWLQLHNNPVVVAGSFSRNAFSVLWKESFVAGIVTDHRVPVFIAHH